jgi:hypothetical protein
MNRNQYLKRIVEIIKNLKSQKEEIQKIHNETLDEQKQTQMMVSNIRKVNDSLENFLFNEGKKDKHAKEIYKEYTRLNENFDKLITNIQQQNKIKNQSREVDVKLEDYRIKFKNGQEITKLE